MQGGVFGWVSDSSRFVKGIKSAFPKGGNSNNR
jgi:hypothetical protein